MYEGIEFSDFEMRQAIREHRVLIDAFFDPDL
jgi:hypothetical protein